MGILQTNKGRLNPLPPRRGAKNVWQELLGPKFTEELIAEAHRDAADSRASESEADSIL